MTLFRNKYRVESARHPHHDYASPGYYFVTICTKNRVHWFGEVMKGIMVLNELGKIAVREWLRTGELRANVRLDEFVVMPNHFHGIVEILDYAGGRDAPAGRLNISTKYVLGDAPAGRLYEKQPLGIIINQFKMMVTKQIRKLNPDFAWQARFHDHILRDNGALERIRAYIRDNPVNWHEDDYYEMVETPRRGVSTVQIDNIR